MIEMMNVSKKYGKGILAVNNLSVRIQDGEFVYVVGPSGAGKSTFIKMMYRQEKATKGRITVGKYDLTKMREREIPYLRRYVGVVFQDFKLLPRLTVYENVAYAMEVIEKSPKEIQRRVEEVLALVNLTHRMTMFPDQLSGGEQQRVAIARALVNNPAVILADEATGNLDTRTSFEILVLFQKLHAEGRTIIFVTHNPDIARYSSRNIQLRDGRVISDEYNNNIQSAAEGLAALPANSDE